MTKETRDQMVGRLWTEEEYLKKLKLLPAGGYTDLLSIADEYMRARKKFPAMRGSHEGYAVILEELDEMWDAIKGNDLAHARKECLQVAAMCLAFLLEVKE